MDTKIKETVKVLRGVCDNCKLLQLYSDNTFHCSFYGSMPRRKLDTNQYCDIDNKPYFGFEDKNGK